MTTKWADSFEDTAAADLASEYTISGGLSIVTGRRAGTSAFAYTSGGITRAIGGTESTIFTSFAFKPTALSSTVRGEVQFQEGSTIHASLHFHDDGTISAYRGDVTSLLGTTANPVFTNGNWTWIQVKLVIHDSTGSVEIRDASGNVLLNLTGKDTRDGGTGYCNTITLRTGSFGTTGAYDDWHIWDTTGSICNTWTNDTRVDHIRPDGDGDVVQFTPSSGANYSCVDEATYNTSDTVSASVAGYQDLYTCGNITHNPQSIFSVLRTAVAQKDDAGARSLKMLTTRSGTIYAGSAITLNNGSYIRLADVQETDPSTSAAWTQSGVNAAQFGIENV